MEVGEPREWTHQGVRCKILKVDMGHWCGYARTSLSGFTESDLYHAGQRIIEVHGGMTYGPDDGGWVGFDCHHAGDLCLNERDEPWGQTYEDLGIAPTELKRHGSVEACEDADRTAVWRLADVKDETERLAEQLAALECFVAAVD